MTSLKSRVLLRAIADEEPVIVAVTGGEKPTEPDWNTVDDKGRKDYTNRIGEDNG